MMKRIFKALIYLYRQGISRYRQPRCIYIPTCSSYALEAIDRFGAIRGGLLSVWRILRCNPFSRGGYDPVPEHFTFRREYRVYCKKKRTSAAKSSLLTPYSVRLFKDDNGGN